MREIKYRGKRIDNGELVYGSYVRYEHMGVVKHIIITNWAQVYVNSHYVVSETVGQFTGLYDKNGKAIYEGDIVHAISKPTKNLEPHETILEVVFHNGQFTTKWSKSKQNNRQTYLPLNFIIERNRYKVTVIGNIYENPDLLKEDSHAV